MAAASRALPRELAEGQRRFSAWRATHADTVAAAPEQWLPWNYRAASADTGGVAREPSAAVGPVAALAADTPVTPGAAGPAPPDGNASTS